MHVARLTLQHFRLYRRLARELSPGITLFYGPNASGKTTILESLFYLATTRSPRSSADRELVSWDAPADLGLAPFARLSAQVQRHDGRLLLEVLIQRRQDEEGQLLPASQKTIRINSVNRRGIDLVGQLRVVMFAPQDLALVTGAPSERRRYLDVTLSQLDGRYVRALASYNQVLLQRNGLLRAWREGRRPRRRADEELGFWDQKLAESGAYVLSERRRAIVELDELAALSFARIAGDDAARLQLRYQETIPDDGVERFRAALSDSRAEELARGQTVVGPHRDDLLITVGGREIGLYGSRGQQRSATLALRLAEAELMRRRTDDTPVLLLDDLLSELDARRREQLLQVILQPGQQTLISATDLADFDAGFLSQITRVRVETGKVYPWTE
jgi:DNA replication and repair protein RecF